MAEWQLDTSSGVPIYVQLKQQIIQKILLGEWQPGHQLPTVRQLAVDVRVNVNTVSRVYAEVEREGFITTQQGKGTFVKKPFSAEHNSAERKQAIQQFAEIVTNMALAQGISIQELIAGLREIAMAKDSKATPEAET
ncbi:GntR family transcriptional regulator [Alicyclobacillus acidiphilus]|uniref:GntR family transcriptional regulator n=1 Tax=Alicyclobacillus acidiphilus TaxID=182455 RepID=UPI000830D443|nr:GntR family transcriptional regulator [Alicyclobacillus acidiphilus]